MLLIPLLMLMAVCSKAATPKLTALPEPTPIWLTPQLQMLPSAWVSAAEIYHEGWLARTEMAMCISRYDLKDSVITIRELRRADSVLSHSALSVEYRCDAPVLAFMHTHLVENGWRYTLSPVDSGVSRVSPFPFQILMSDAHAFTVLWKPIEQGTKRPHD